MIELCKAWFNPYLLEEDRIWLLKHLKFANVSIPTVDISWITVEFI
jgi:hypothetical protein